MIFYKELGLEEGFETSELQKNHRIVAGREVSTASGIELFKSLRGSPIRCWACGCEADRWISCRGENDISRPVLNLFATKHVRKTKHRAAYSMIVMMTRDHIIPKADGGIDVVENLRPGCESCNTNRGTKMTEADQVFKDTHPHLISQERLAKARAAAAKHIANIEIHRNRQAEEHRLAKEQEHA